MADVIEHAERDGWSAKLSADIRRYIDEHARMRSLPDRSLVYAVGDPPDGLYRVVSGEVRLMSYPVPGRQLLNIVVRAGRWFGELSVLDHGPRPHDAVCHGPTRLSFLSMHHIAQLTGREPLFFRDIALIACHHQRAALTYLGATLAKPALARVADMILAMLPSAGEEALLVRINQEDLAGRIGVSRPHLNHLLGRLRQQGSIATSYGAIEVLDREALVDVADWTD